MFQQCPYVFKLSNYTKNLNLSKDRGNIAYIANHGLKMQLIYI